MRGFPLRGYSIPGRNGTWAWTPWRILLGAPPPSPLEGPTYYQPTYLPTYYQPTYLPTYMPKEWAYMPKEWAYMPKEWAYHTIPYMGPGPGLGFPPACLFGRPTEHRT